MTLTRRLTIALTLLFATLAFGQGQQGVTFTTATTGTATPLANTAIAWHMISWTILGAPASCTVELDYSTNGTSWTAGGVIGAQTCTSPGQSAIVNQSVNFVRINVTALSAGATLTVTWNGFINNPAVGSSNTGVLNTGTYAYYVDATNGIFLNTAAGDACLAINRALIFAISNGITKVIAPFTGFWSCNTNIWQVSGGVSPGSSVNEIEFGAAGKNSSATSALISSVPQYTPYVGGNFHAAQAANSGLTQGAIITYCGPELPFYSASGGGQCTFTDGAGNSRTVNAPSSTTTVVFNIAHGPFPAGNYLFLFGFQGEGIASDSFPAGQGWNRDGNTMNWQGIAISCGGNLACFDGYDLNGDENTKFRDFRVSGPASSNSPWAGIFFDRTECCTTQPGTGWARWSIEHLNYAGLGLTSANNSSYGIVELGSDVTVVVTGGSCTGTVKAWITKTTGNTPTQMAVDPNNMGGGTCVTPTVTIYGAANCWNSATGNVAGTAGGCTNNTGNFGLNLTATATPVVVNGYMIGATITAGSGYPNAFITGGTLIQWIDSAGASGANLAYGVYVDGCLRCSVKEIHGINTTFAVLDLGEKNLTAGGVFCPCDGSNVGGEVQLGPGIDGNQFIEPVSAQTGTILVDNHHLPPLTLTTTNYPQGIPGYNPTGLFVPGAVGTFGSPGATIAGTTAAFAITASNQIVMWGIVLNNPTPLNSLTYIVNVADNTADIYNFAICQGANSSYCMPIVDTGGVAGTTSMAATGLQVLSWANAYQGYAIGDILPPGRYYFLMTCSTAGAGNCATTPGKLSGSGASGAGSQFTWFTPVASATASSTGLFNGTCSGSCAFPIATPAGNTWIENTIPSLVFH
jgi:hypothetical protein